VVDRFLSALVKRLHRPINLDQDWMIRKATVRESVVPPDGDKKHTTAISGVALTALYPFAAIAVAFSYQLGSGVYYGIPSELLRVDVIQAVGVILPLLLILSTLAYWVFNPLIKLQRLDENDFMHASNSIMFMIVVLCIILIVSVPSFYLFNAAILWSAITSIIIYRARGRGKASAQTADNDFGITGLMLWFLGRRRLEVTMAIMVILSMSYSAGYDSAAAKQLYLVTMDGKDAVVAQYGDDFVVAALQRQSPSCKCTVIRPTYSIMTTLSQSTISLNLENLGQLHRLGYVNPSPNRAETFWRGILKQNVVDWFFS
jgi:hypothetical protein